MATKLDHRALWESALDDEVRVIWESLTIKQKRMFLDCLARYTAKVKVKKAEISTKTAAQ
jgi:hypothetical protein